MSIISVLNLLFIAS